MENHRDVLWTKTPIELSPYQPSFGGLEKESLLTLHSESDAGNEVSRNDRAEASTSVQDYGSISTRRTYSPCGSQWSWVHPYFCILSYLSFQVSMHPKTTRDIRNLICLRESTPSQAMMLFLFFNSS
jgi:hypothetical protein